MMHPPLLLTHSPAITLANSSGVTVIPFERHEVGPLIQRGRQGSRTPVRAIIRKEPSLCPCRVPVSGQVLLVARCVRVAVLVIAVVMLSEDALPYRVADLTMTLAVVVRVSACRTAFLP